MPASPSLAGAAPRLTRRGFGPALSIAIACFVVWGLAYGLLDVLNKHFQETLHVGRARSTWLQTAYFGAYLAASVPAGRLLARAGYKAALVSGLLLTAAGALCFIPAAALASFSAFVAAIFVLASGLCVLETAADTYVTALGPAQTATRRLNLAQSFNALGVALGPIIGGATFLGHTDTRGGLAAVSATYLVIASFVGGFALLVARANLPSPEEDEAAESHHAASPWRRRHYRLGVLTQALYVGAQVGVGALFINLVTETWPGMGARGGAFLLALATAAYLAGRFFSTWLLGLVAARTLLALYGTACTLLCLVVALRLPHGSAVALILVYFFMSAMFPTIFTLGVADLGAATRRGAGFMVMAVGGGVLLPYPMGRLAEAFGTATAYLLPAAAFAAVALYGAYGARVIAAPAMSSHG